MAEKKRILMVEDDLYLLKLYKNTLVDAGFDVIEATNGVEGLAKVEAEKPDLVILDVILPRKNGLDVLGEIRKKKEYNDTPVIVHSILGQDADVQKGMDLGASDYIIKMETNLQEVVEKVRHHLGMDET